MEGGRSLEASLLSHCCDSGHKKISFFFAKNLAEAFVRGKIAPGGKEIFFPHTQTSFSRLRKDGLGKKRMEGRKRRALQLDFV